VLAEPGWAASFGPVRQRVQPTGSDPPQRPPHGGLADRQLLGDLGHGLALVAELHALQAHPQAGRHRGLPQPRTQLGVLVRSQPERCSGPGHAASISHHQPQRQRLPGHDQLFRHPLAAALFILIGAQPHTAWLAGTLQLDQHGFVLTGPDLLQGGRPPPGWLLDRLPLPLETGLPGVFAAGDVRHRSVKRVASAVGEGSIAIQLVHDYLGEN
jgi:hypothetical protein